jgi:hypothetical protein
MKKASPAKFDNRIYMRHIAVLALVFLAVVFSFVIAEPEPSDYLVRVKIYSDGNIKTAYMRHWGDRLYERYNELGPRYKPTDFHSKPSEPDSLSGKYLIYLNRMLPEDRVWPGKISSLVIGDSIFSLKYKGKLLVDYLIKSRINIDSIDMIEVDSLLWANDYHQEQWIDTTTAEIFKKCTVIFTDIWKAQNCGDCSYWIDIFSVDTAWTKSRFRKYFNKIPFDTSFGHGDFNAIKLFHPQIQKAIAEKKLFAIEHWAP